MTAHERIDTSLRLFDKPVGDIRLYKRVLREAEGDTELADAYCLSSMGGFTRAQLNRIKYEIEYRKVRYQKFKFNCV